MYILCSDKKKSNRELQGGSVSDFVRHKNFALEPVLTLCLTCSCPIFFSPPKDFCNTHSELVLQTCLLLFLPGELTRNATIRNKNNQRLHLWSVVTKDFIYYNELTNWRFSNAHNGLFTTMSGHLITKLRFRRSFWGP